VTSRRAFIGLAILGAAAAPRAAAVQGRKVARTPVRAGRQHEDGQDLALTIPGPVLLRADQVIE